jgi:Skp family chaperone for outer membrane proteins
VTINKFSQNYEIPDEKLRYSELKDRIRGEITVALPKKERVMLLAKKLEDDLTIKDTICDQICTDFRDIISERYIQKCLSDEYKQKRKKREESTSRSPNGAANEDKNVPEQTVQVAGTGEETYESEPAKPSALLKNIQTELESKTKELEEAKKKIAILQESQNVEDIPQLVDNKIGPVKVTNLSKINQYDRRGYQILSSRFGELVRRKLAAEGKASIKFYIVAKDRSTNIEYLVPVSFTVNMLDKCTDMILDESRL